MTLESKDHSLDELDRVVVKVGADVPLYWDHFVPIVFDRAEDGEARPSLLSKKAHHLAFVTEAAVFSLLCDDRAQRCVDGLLRVNGQPILPERYLGLWRSAFSQPIPLGDLATRYSLRLFAMLSGPLDRLRGAQAPRPDSPFATFDDFESRYAERMIVGTDHMFALKMDLTEPNAVRDMCFGEEFLLRIRNEAQIVTGIELEVSARSVPVQCSMFSFQENTHVVSN